MTDEAADTVFLRFRDLVTEPNGTIVRHRAIVDAKGYVWWGWWNKFGEKVPAEVFQMLNARASSQDLPILLFDSGQELVWRANCSAIHWPQDGSTAPSPEADATPEYYRDRHYLAWFRFTDIAQLPTEAGVLRTYTYVRVDSFFESGTSTYGDFYGKIVYSPEELRQQDRTIWFVRASRTEDLRHEIKLLGAQKLQPSHFPREFRESSSRKLLWISDPHFSDDQHEFPRKTDAARFELAGALERDLKVMGVSELAGMLVSGDLTWRAAEEEFNFAAEFVRQVISWSRLDPYQILVAPGNHDLRFSETPFDKGAEITVAPEAARVGYEKFYRQLYFLHANPFLSCGRRFLLGGAVAVEVVSLNSSLLQQAEGMFQGHGFVGEEQMLNAAEEFGWREGDDGPRPFRIVMLHHHVMPVSHREIPVAGRTYSVVLDAGALLRWAVRHRVDLILHGHMHQPYVSTLSLPLQAEGPARDWHALTIAAMGSSGVSRTHLGEIGRHTFGLLQFETSSVTVTIHAIDPVRGYEPGVQPVREFEVGYAHRDDEAP